MPSATDVGVERGAWSVEHYLGGDWKRGRSYLLILAATPFLLLAATPFLLSRPEPIYETVSYLLMALKILCQ